MINERISALRNLMEQNKINAYCVPCADGNGTPQEKARELQLHKLARAPDL